MAALSAKMFFLCSFICSTHLNSEIIILRTSHKHKNISLAHTYSPAALCWRGGHPNTTLKHPGETIEGRQVATHALSRPVCLPCSHAEAVQGCSEAHWAWSCSEVRKITAGKLVTKTWASLCCFKPNLIFVPTVTGWQHVPLECVLWMSKIVTIKGNECLTRFISRSMPWASLSEGRFVFVVSLTMFFRREWNLDIQEKTMGSKKSLCSGDGEN